MSGAEQEPLAGRRAALLGGFTTAHFSHHVSNSLLNPLLPFIRDAFALSYTQSGLLVSAYSMSLGLSNAPIGLLADRVGSRPVIVWGLMLTGVVSAALSFSGAYWQLFLMLVLLGIISGTYHAPAASLIARAFPPRTRGAAMGFHITGGHLSFFAAPLTAAFLVSATGTWRTPYLWLAFAPVLSGILIWYLAPRGREPTSAGADRLAVFRDVRAVVRLVGPLVSMSLLFQLCYAALTAFTSLYLVDARGVPAALAAVLFGVPQLVGVLGAPLGGLLSDRFGRRAVILLGMGSLGPALLLLTLVPNELLLVPLALIGLAASMRTTVTEVLVMDSTPPHRRATVLGGYYLLSQELGGLAAPLLGVLASAIGIGSAYGGVAAGLAGVSLLVVLLHRRL